MIGRLLDWLVAWDQRWAQLNRQLDEARRQGFRERDVAEMRRTAIHLARHYPSMTPAQHAEVELRAMMARRLDSATWRSRFGS